VFLFVFDEMPIGGAIHVRARIPDTKQVEDLTKEKQTNKRNISRGDKKKEAERETKQSSLRTFIFCFFLFLDLFECPFFFLSFFQVRFQVESEATRTSL
jgi:hypothetical protein